MLKFLSQALAGITVLTIALPATAAQLKESAILSAIKHAAIERNHLAPEDVQVSWQDLDIHVLVPFIPEGPVSLSIPPSAHLGGRENVPVQVEIGGNTFRTIFPRVDIAVMRRVLVAVNPISQGTGPGPSDVASERVSVDAPNAYARPITSYADLDGAQAIRDIAPGTPLTTAMFRVPPLVKVGDDVSVTLTDGDLTLETTGLAQGSGARGQTIRVLNPNSHKEFMARVTGPRAVSVSVEDDTP